MGYTVCWKKVFLFCQAVEKRVKRVKRYPGGLCGTLCGIMRVRADAWVRPYGNDGMTVFRYRFNFYLKKNL